MVSFRAGVAPSVRGRSRAAGLTGWFVLLLAGVSWAVAATPSGSESSLLERWLHQAQGLKSWESNFVQTRHLKALTQPLKTTGRVWFAAPDRFRWELGDPPQSLVLRDGALLQVLSPRLHRAEQLSLTNVAAGPMREAMALLDTGFPRDAETFQTQFKLLSTRTNSGSGGESSYAFRLQPRSAAARRFLPELTVEVAGRDLQLTATELQFADGSRLRNDFTGARINPPVDPERFRTNLDASWKIVVPGAAP